MPQKNMSSQIGKSSSPTIQRIVEKNKNVQQPGAKPGIVKSAYNKCTVKV